MDPSNWGDIGELLKLGKALIMYPPGLIEDEAFYVADYFWRRALNVGMTREIFARFRNGQQIPTDKQRREPVYPRLRTFLANVLARNRWVQVGNFRYARNKTMYSPSPLTQDILEQYSRYYNVGAISPANVIDPLYAWLWDPLVELYAVVGALDFNSKRDSKAVPRAINRTVAASLAHVFISSYVKIVSYPCVPAHTADHRFAVVPADVVGAASFVSFGTAEGQHVEEGRVSIPAILDIDIPRTSRAYFEAWGIDFLAYDYMLACFVYVLKYDFAKEDSHGFPAVSTGDARFFSKLCSLAFDIWKKRYSVTTEATQVFNVYSHLFMSSFSAPEAVFKKTVKVDGYDRLSIIGDLPIFLPQVDIDDWFAWSAPVYAVVEEGLVYQPIKEHVPMEFYDWDRSIPFNNEHVSRKLLMPPPASPAPLVRDATFAMQAGSSWLYLLSHLTNARDALTQGGASITLKTPMTVSYSKTEQRAVNSLRLDQAPTIKRNALETRYDSMNVELTIVKPRQAGVPYVSSWSVPAKERMMFQLVPRVRKSGLVDYLITEVTDSATQGPGASANHPAGDLDPKSKFVDMDAIRKFSGDNAHVLLQWSLVSYSSFIVLPPTYVTG
jgi:hypothetical protein